MLLFPEINRLWSQDFPSQCWFVNIESDCVERPFRQMGVNLQSYSCITREYKLCGCQNMCLPDYQSFSSV